MKPVAVAFLTIFSAALLAGCSTQAAEDLEVGQCFDDEDLEAEEIATVPIVDCSEPHDNEVFHVFQLDEADVYPGDAAIATDSDVECVGTFETYVGTDYDSSILDYSTLYPTEQTWADGDREVICSLYHVDLEKLTGSSKGTAQ